MNLTKYTLKTVYYCHWNIIFALIPSLKNLISLFEFFLRTLCIKQPLGHHLILCVDELTKLYYTKGTTS